MPTGHRQRGVGCHRACGGQGADGRPVFRRTCPTADAARRGARPRGADDERIEHLVREGPRRGHGWASASSAGRSPRVWLRRLLGDELEPIVNGPPRLGAHRGRRRRGDTGRDGSLELSSHSPNGHAGEGVSRAIGSSDLLEPGGQLRATISYFAVAAALSLTACSADEAESFTDGFAAADDHAQPPGVEKVFEDRYSEAGTLSVYEDDRQWPHAVGDGRDRCR